MKDFMAMQHPGHEAMMMSRGRNLYSSVSQQPTLVNIDNKVDGFIKHQDGSVPIHVPLDPSNQQIMHGDFGMIPTRSRNFMEQNETMNETCIGIGVGGNIGESGPVHVSEAKTVLSLFNF